jgi:hypothetical protein
VSASEKGSVWEKELESGVGWATAWVKGSGSAWAVGWATAWATVSASEKGSEWEKELELAAGWATA